jgi:hypothetical protein
MLQFARETVEGISESVLDEVDFEELRTEDTENLLQVGYLQMVLVLLDSVIGDANAQKANASEDLTNAS